MENRKEQLQKELTAIIEQETKEMIKANYPQIKKDFEGKYYKVRNTYGGECKGWWLYKKITKIKPESLYEIANGIAAHCEGFTFQKTNDGIITIEKSKHIYLHGVGKEISKREFMKAWKSIQDQLSKLIH